jgi:hypothetical protein
MALFSSRSLMLLCFIWLTVASFLFVTSCTDTSPTSSINSGSPGENRPEDELDIYIPNDFSGMDLNNNSSTWSYHRSRESEHFIVFWGRGYGSFDPGSQNVDEAYRVDIDDLLEKAELFYDQNVDDLNFAVVGEGESNLDEYKMMIFLYHQDEWLATGAGYDDVIGALWVSPHTAQPAGPVIAHEIGHSFQYQVHSDFGGGSGFRYGFGGNGGNTFWEQTANWQAMVAYPDQIFRASDFNVYTENYHKHIHHEDYRYASYFIHYYWTDKHGPDFIGRLWREAREPEDPIQAYMRLTDINTEQMNDEVFDAARRFVTWDLDQLRERGFRYIGDHTYNFSKFDESGYRVDYGSAPQTTGYNVIPLELPDEGESVSIEFTGIPNAEGFNQVDASIAGWRYGFVALLDDGNRMYSDMSSGIQNNVTFDVPENTRRLWFVVTGAPTVYSQHAWDADNSNDSQWPYELSLTNTTILDVN